MKNQTMNQSVKLEDHLSLPCNHILGLDDYGNHVQVNDDQDLIVDYYNFCPTCGINLVRLN